MTRSELRLPAALVVLSIVPVLAGAVRVASLAAGGPITPANARFFAAPAPVVLHVIGRRCSASSEPPVSW
jgi:hypothetical protein